jgi:hypothetical protein
VDFTSTVYEIGIAPLRGRLVRHDQLRPAHLDAGVPRASAARRGLDELRDVAVEIHRELRELREPQFRIAGLADSDDGRLFAAGSIQETNWGAWVSWQVVTHDNEWLRGKMNVAPCGAGNGASVLDRAQAEVHVDAHAAAPAS